MVKGGWHSHPQLPAVDWGLAAIGGSVSCQLPGYVDPGPLPAQKSRLRRSPADVSVNFLSPLRPIGLHRSKISVDDLGQPLAQNLKYPMPACRVRGWTWRRWEPLQVESECRSERVHCCSPPASTAAAQTTPTPIQMRRTRPIKSRRTPRVSCHRYRPLPVRDVSCQSGSPLSRSTQGGSTPRSSTGPIRISASPSCQTPTATSIASARRNHARTAWRESCATSSVSALQLPKGPPKAGSFSEPGKTTRFSTPTPTTAT